jgi:hypothetical protein
LSLGNGAADDVYHNLRNLVMDFKAAANDGLGNLIDS